MNSTVPLALILLTGVAMITDITARRIPNFLILIGLVGGTLVQTLQGDLLQGVLTLLLMFALTFPLFLLQGLGAGDVKLLMVLGLWTDPLWGFSIFFWTAMAGGVLAILVMGGSRQGSHSWRNFRAYLYNFLVLRVLPPTNADSKSATLPYAIPIFAGTLLAFFFPLNLFNLWR